MLYLVYYIMSFERFIYVCHEIYYETDKHDEDT